MDSMLDEGMVVGGALASIDGGHCGSVASEGLVVEHASISFVVFASTAVLEAFASALFQAELLAFLKAYALPLKNLPWVLGHCIPSFGALHSHKWVVEVVRVIKLGHALLP